MHNQHNPIARFEQRFHAPSNTTVNGMYVPSRVQGIKALGEWKQAGHDQPLWWLRLEIGSAFQQLVALALPGAPAVEMLPATAEMWWLSLGEMELTEEIDRPRIRKGFNLLFTCLRQWPQPVDLIEKLPTRPKQQAQAPAEQTDKQRADGAARLREILDGLGKERDDA